MEKPLIENDEKYEKRDFSSSSALKKSIFIRKKSFMFLTGLALFALVLLCLNDLNSPRTGEVNSLETPKYKLSMCTMFRNEGHYLLEWIAHHVALGYDHFYLYNHISEDHYQDILAPLVEKGIVTLQNVPDVPPFRQQRATFDDCLAHRSESQWMSNLDVDEYIVLSPSLKRTTITSILDQLRTEEGADVLYLFRHHFTTNGNEKAIWRKFDQPDTNTPTPASSAADDQSSLVCPLVTCNYLERNTNSFMASQNSGKFFFDLSSVRNFQVHNVTGFKKAVNAQGDEITPGTLPRVLDPILIHHYVALSLEECMNKKVSSAFGGGWRNKSGDAWCLRQHKLSPQYQPNICEEDNTMLFWKERVMQHMCFLNEKWALKQGVPCKQLKPLQPKEVGREEVDTFAPVSKLLKSFHRSV